MKTKRTNTWENKCLKCKKGYLFNVMLKKDKWTELCTDCNYRRSHKDRRALKREMVKKETPYSDFIHKLLNYCRKIMMKRGK